MSSNSSSTDPADDFPEVDDYSAVDDYSDGVEGHAAVEAAVVDDLDLVAADIAAELASAAANGHHVDTPHAPVASATSEPADGHGVGDVSGHIGDAGGRVGEQTPEQLAAALAEQVGLDLSDTPLVAGPVDLVDHGLVDDEPIVDGLTPSSAPARAGWFPSDEAGGQQPESGLGHEPPHEHEQAAGEPAQDPTPVAEPMAEPAVDPVAVHQAPPEGLALAAQAAEPADPEPSEPVEPAASTDASDHGAGAGPADAGNVSDVGNVSDAGDVDGGPQDAGQIGRVPSSPPITRAPLVPAPVEEPPSPEPPTETVDADPQARAVDQIAVRKLGGFNFLSINQWSALPRDERARLLKGGLVMFLFEGEEIEVRPALLWLQQLARSEGNNPDDPTVRRRGR